MKKTLLYFVLSTALFVSCRKTRTCSCTYSSTTTETKTPQNGGSSVTTTYATPTSTMQESHPKATKKDMRRHNDCISKIVNSTFTTTIIDGDTANPQAFYLEQRFSITYNCEIK